MFEERKNKSKRRKKKERNLKVKKGKEYGGKKI
jgi:hypothetical protein